MSVLVFLLFSLIAFGLAAFLTPLVRNGLLARKIIDAPNVRSMHDSPVPRGGGLVLLPVFSLGFLLGFSFSEPYALWLVASLALLSLISWRDDRDNGSGVVLRLAAHLLAATMGCFALGPEATIFGGVLPFWLDRGVTILVWTWFINLTNFMDGIDGIACAQSVCSACAVAAILIMTEKEEPLDLILAASIAGACAGFLIFNWHPAKIFLGDTGSVPLGFLTGYLLFRIAAHGFPAAAVIIPLYFLADSGLTLAKRVVRGEKFWTPHRSHFYQRAARGLGRHDTVVVWVLAANLALAFLAEASLSLPWPMVGAALLVVAFLLRKMHKSGLKSDSS